MTMAHGVCSNVDYSIEPILGNSPYSRSQIEWPDSGPLLLQVPRDRWGEGGAGLEASCVHNYDNSPAWGDP